MTNEIMNWAIRHNISATAIDELRRLMGFTPIPSFRPADLAGSSESNVQSRVRLEASRKGVALWRNNSGVMMNPEGQPVRYGLANDSKRLNEVIKSADLIGWRPVLIDSMMVGSVIGQFVSRECKPAGWKYTGTDREKAQLRWIEAVTAAGGDAKFVTGEGTL